MLALASVALAFAPSPLRTIPVQRHAVGAPVMVGGNTICGDIDADELSANLLNYLVLNSGDEEFSDYTMGEFKGLVAQAYPDYESRSAEIFNAVDKGGSGRISFQDFFSTLVAGPIFDSPKFAPCVWSEVGYGCKDKFVDDDHKVLFNLINGLTDSTKTGDMMKVQKSIAGLKEYTVYHFDREIEMLSKLKQYPVAQLNAHKAAHKAFVDKVATFERKIAAQNIGALTSLVNGEMIDFLKKWLSQHIQATDMKFHKYF